MPKTLLYTIDYPPMRGGVARYLSALAEYFGSNLSVVGPGSARNRWWSAAADLVARKGSYEILIVSHVLPLGTAAMVARLMTGRPYVVIVHGMDIGLAKRNVAKRMLVGLVLRNAKLVVANSMSLEREVRRDFGVTRSVTVYPPVTAVPSAAQRTCGTGFRLLTVARLIARKGHLRVLDALAVLRKRHPEVALDYTIVGDGPMRQTIVDRIQSLALPNVRIVSDASDADLSILYASADAFVMPVIRDPSDREGFGMAYLEAAAYGVPSIATDMPGVDEAVLNGITGILVPDGDANSLPDALYLLATDPVLRHRLGSEAQRRVAEDFSLASQFSKLNSRL